MTGTDGATDTTGTPPHATAAWPQYTEGAWRDTHRLIPATYVDRSEPFLAALVDPTATDPEDDIVALTVLAAATSTRLQAQADLSTLHVGSHELVYDLDYSAFINGAFTYPGIGARFHDHTRGAWYAALAIETALAEVAHHRTQALAEIDVFEDQLDYQDFACDIGGQHFADLRDDHPSSRACLDPDSYVASQGLAAELLALGAAGVVWSSVRHPGGTCIACFRPSLLPPVAQGDRYRLTWTGEPTPTISRADDA